ncbi:MAG: hypothetical protein IPO48_07285 [Saprospiraceae bacterium]|nr:hypothetical protein [Saprospiraceae bacterium]
MPVRSVTVHMVLYSVTFWELGRLLIAFPLNVEIVLCTPQLSLVVGVL